MILPNFKEYYYESCTGIKTGHTTPAGNCLVASSSKNGIDLISIVLGGETNSQGLNERFYDTKQLFDLTYNNYSIKKIANENQVIKSIEVKKATKETALLDVIVDTDISTIIPNSLNIDNLEKIITIDDEIEAPIKKNQVLGKITFKADGLNYTTDLIASHDVKKIPYELYNMIVVGTIVLIVIIAIIVLISFIIKKYSNEEYDELPLEENDKDKLVSDKDIDEDELDIKEDEDDEYADEDELFLENDNENELDSDENKD